MKTETILYTAAAVLCASWLLAPSRTHAARGRNFNFNFNFIGDAETCTDLKATSSNGEIARSDEKFTLTRAEAPLLELNGGDRAQIRVRGWDKAEYTVETCKIAVADSKSAAEQTVKGITVAHAAGRLSYNGPSPSDQVEWTAVFLIHAPRDARLDLETKNGPIDVRGVNGDVKLRATNGPVAIQDCGGNVDAQTSNGPIAYSGDRGEVHLHANNGPIALKLSGDVWNGSMLEARTINGPLAVSLPDNFRSGVRLETAGHSPLSCNAAPCRTAYRANRTLQMNGASDTIRLSTENGPVAIQSDTRKKIF